MSNLIPRSPYVCTDAYKPSHYLQIPEGTDWVRYYMAPRKQAFVDKEFVTFGALYGILQHLADPTTEDSLNEILRILNHFNVAGTAYPFNIEGARKVLQECNGYLPLTIRAIPEGKPFNKYNVPVLLVEAKGKDYVWLAGFIETWLQRNYWYQSTVATLSRGVRKYLAGLYNQTVDDKDRWTLNYRLHDFGARGASSGETAATGGAAHLINFNGTDTLEAVWLLDKMFPGLDIAELASSIPAAEHFTVTIYPDEIKALKNMINKFGKMPLFAFVSDSYDYKKMVDEVWCDPEIIAEIRAAGVIPVVRPDSGDPNEMVMYALNKLAASWGYTTNEKGYKVLNGINVIQGDGMDYKKIIKLYKEIVENGFSPQNVAVGMGGGLLQKVNRDDMSWSMKCYTARVNGDWITLQKNPKTDPTKKAWAPQDYPINQQDYEVFYHMEPGMAKPEIITANADYFRKVREYARAGL